LCWVIATYPVIELPSDIYYITKVPVSVRWQDILAVVAVGYALCFAAAVYPAMRSSKISPVDAIRYG
ncbi:MAG: lipoprotein-releasing system transmembrane subunit LolC, partial [Elusimicrobia bacterium]|nr:lipoprotein-releasing system transmembrane subunit LolC [Elusimicrobiota bacterium]